MTDKAKTDKLKGGKKLAASANNEKHIQALAKKIMEDPSFPMLHETARKAAEQKKKGS
jgi:hypothetical protein